MVVRLLFSTLVFFAFDVGFHKVHAMDCEEIARIASMELFDDSTPAGSCLGGPPRVFISSNEPARHHLEIYKALKEGADASIIAARYSIAEIPEDVRSWISASAQFGGPPLVINSSANQQSSGLAGAIIEMLSKANKTLCSAIEGATYDKIFSAAGNYAVTIKTSGDGLPLAEQTVSEVSFQCLE